MAQTQQNLILSRLSRDDLALIQGLVVKKLKLPRLRRWPSQRDRWPSPLGGRERDLDPLRLLLPGEKLGVRVAEDRRATGAIS